MENLVAVAEIRSVRERERERHPRRNQIIDLAKLVFIICVAFNHTNSIGLLGEKFEIIMQYGFLGVEFFFIVSGYLMTVKAVKVDLNTSTIGKSTEGFILRKLRIIMPYYFAAWVIGFVANHIGSEQGIAVIFKDLLLSIPSFLQINMAGFKGYNPLGPTWYLSAMFISMLALYPLMLKLRDSFTYVVAPLIAVFCYGYLIQVNGHYAAIEPAVGGIIYMGLLRGLAGISLGCISFEFAKKLKELSITKAAKAILTFIEAAAYLAAVIGMQTQSLFRPDVIIVLCFFVAVTISFSQQSCSPLLFRKNHAWIGRLATCIYLADAPARTIVKIMMPDKGYYYRFVPCLITTFVLAIIVWILGDAVSRAAKNISASLKGKFIVAA